MEKIEKRKNKRLKSYNYTEKREKLKKVVEKAITSSKKTTKSQIAKEANYNGNPNTNTTRAIPDMIEELYPLSQQLGEHIAITQAGDEQGQVKLKGHEMLYRLRDAFPVQKQKIDSNVSITSVSDIINKLDNE
jgi:hypothetical protein